jgi:hypothetical protein
VHMLLHDEYIATSFETDTVFPVRYNKSKMNSLYLLKLEISHFVRGLKR